MTAPLAEAIRKCRGRLEYDREGRNHEAVKVYAADLELILNTIEPLLSEAGCVQVPAGWKIVPIEPNWDMRNEGREFLIDGLEKDYEKIAYFLWKTMINAAPLPTPPEAV